MATKAKTPKTPKKPKAAEVATKYRIGIGDKAPAFKVSATGTASPLTSAQFKGRAYVIYFYPRDNTPGCTLEGQDFQRLCAQFEKLGCDVLGVSKDSMKAHEKFCEAYGFQFPLLSDDQNELARAYDVVQMKSLYGRKYEGVERSTFLISKAGKICGEWRKVKVPGHVEAVLAFAKANL